MPAARRVDVLTEELTTLWIQEPDVEIRPLHLDALADPTGWRGVVRGIDFDAAIEMDRAPAEAVVAKGLDRQRLQRRSFFGKHGGNLALGRVMDPGIRPVRLPAIQIRLGLLERLEALALERRLLRVADAGFDLAFAIGIAAATRQADDTVVREHIPIQWIERRLVDVGREHAYFEVVEHDHSGRATESAKGPLVQFGPRLRTRLPDQESYGFARVAEGEDKQTRTAKLSGLRMADHRSVTVVDLRFFYDGRRDDDARLGRGRAAQLPDEATDTGVSGGESFFDQVLSDRHRVATELERGFDSITMRLARTGLWRARRRGGPRPRRRVGGHLRRNGRFSLSFSGSPTAANENTGRFQIVAGRLATNAGSRSMRRNVHPSRPSARTCCCVRVSKTFPMATEEHQTPRRGQRLDQRVSGNGRFEVSINGRCWVSTEAPDRRPHDRHPSRAPECQSAASRSTGGSRWADRRANRARRNFQCATAVACSVFPDAGLTQLMDSSRSVALSPMSTTRGLRGKRYLIHDRDALFTLGFQDTRRGWCPSCPPPASFPESDRL